MGGSSYSTEATQYFNRLPTEIGADTLAVYATFIDSLVGYGLWDKIDEMGILANKTSANALIGVKGLVDATLISTPTFAVYKGFTGGTDKAIDTHLAPDSNCVNYVLNSASFGVYSRTNSADATRDIGWYNGVNTESTTYFNAGTFYFRINGFTWQGVAMASTLGFFCVDRTNATTSGTVDNGAYTSVASNSAGLAKITFAILGQHTQIGTINNPSSRQIAFWYVGGHFTSSEYVVFNRLVEAMLDGVGAGVKE